MFIKLEAKLYEGIILGNLYRIEKIKGTWKAFVKMNGSFQLICEEKKKIQCEIQATLFALK